MAKIKLTAKRKKIAISVGAVLLVVSVGVFALMKWTLFENEGSPGESRQAAEAAHLAARASADEGDVDGALSQYDEAIEGGDDDTRQSLLLRKANLALQSARQDEALEAALQAEDIKPTATTAEVLATIYEQRGDKESAITYYKEIIERTAEDSPGARYLSIWESKIKELEQ